MTTPISPKDAKAEKISAIPEEVVEIINRMIIEKFQGRSFSLRADEVRTAIFEKMGKCESWWLDFEPAYRAVGWNVNYDKPGFNESYPATYDFRVKGS